MYSYMTTYKLIIYDHNKSMHIMHAFIVIKVAKSCKLVVSQKIHAGFVATWLAKR